MQDKTAVGYTACAKEMAEMKKTEAYAFLKEVDSVSLQQSLRHLDTAFQNFFRQPKTGFPRFKSRKHNRNSYTTVCINGNISMSDGYLKLPKAGQIRIKQHRPARAADMLTKRQRILLSEHGTVRNVACTMTEM